MNKMRRTVALFIAMLMLFSCVQGGVFTAMAVDDVPNEQSAVEEVSVAEEPSEPSEADEVGSEQPTESDEELQGDTATSEEPSESEITESTEVETSEPSTGPSEEEAVESSEVSETTEVVEETQIDDSVISASAIGRNPNQEPIIVNIGNLRSNGYNLRSVPVVGSTLRIYHDFTSLADYPVTGSTTGDFPWMATGYVKDGTLKLPSGCEWVYCIDKEKSTGSFTYKDVTALDFYQMPAWTSLSEQKQIGITNTLLWGVPNCDSSYDNLYGYIATQCILWEWQLGYRTSMTSTTKNLANLTNNSTVKSYYTDILNLLKLHEGKLSFNGTTVTLKGYGEDYAVTLTDTTGTFARDPWVITTPSGLVVSHSSGSNSVKVYATSSFADGSSSTVSLKRNVVRDSSRNAVGLLLGDQASICGNPKDMVTASFTVKMDVQKGSATIKKTSGTGDVNGYCFKIWCGATGSTYYGKTDSSGNLHLTNSSYTGDSGTTITGLLDGDYSIREVLSQKGEGLVRPTSVRITVKNSSGTTTYDKTFGVDDMYVPDGSNDYAVRANGITGLSGGGTMTITVNNSPLSEITLKKASDTESVANKIFCLAGTSMRALDIYDGNQNGYIFFKTDSNGNAYVTDANYNKASNGIYKLTGVLDGKFRILEKPGSMSTGASLKSIKLTLTPSIPGSKVSITYTNESGNSVTTSSTTGAVTATITNTSTLDGWTGADVILEGLSAGANLSIEFNNATEPGWSELSKVTTDGSSKSGFCFKFVNNSASNFATSITSTWYGKTNTSGKMYVTNSSYSSTSTTYKFTGMYDGYYSITEDLVKSGKKDLYEPTKWTVKITNSAGTVTTKTFTKASNTLSSQPSTSSKTEGIYKDSSGNYTLYVNVVGLSGGGSMSITVDNEPTSKPITISKSINATSDCLAQLKNNHMFNLDASGNVTVAGAKYKVMLTNGGSTYETLTIGSNGKATSSKTYQVNTTVYIQEVEAPKGFKLDTTVYPLTIKSDSSQNTVSVSDMPLFDPVFVINKIDKTTGNPQGDSSFKGAVFKFEYFDASYSTVSGSNVSINIPSSATATRTWYFQTDENWVAQYGDGWLADGYSSDSLYIESVSDTGQIFYGLPCGTLKITEVKHSLGYTVIKVPLYVEFYADSDGDISRRWDSASKALLNAIGDANESNDPNKWKAIGIDEPIDIDLFGSFTLQKTLTNSGTDLQGNMRDLEAEFNVINRSANSVKIGDFDEAEPGEVCFSFWTDRSGYYASEKIFPLGTYEIVEVTPPAGTTLNTSWKGSFVVTEKDKDADPQYFECENSPVLAGFKVYKFDKDRLDSNSLIINYPQGGANFNGATFAVYNESQRPVYVGGVEYQPGEVCYTFTIKSIIASRPVNSYTSATNLLPYGSYRIVETKSPTGYFLNEGWEARFDITSNDAGKNVNANSRLSSPLPEEIYRGGIQIKKLDTETGEAWQGGAVMSGAVFAIYNNSAQAVYTDRDGNGTMAWYNKDQICLYLTTGSDGVATSSTDALPYGSYYAVEVRPPEGYKLNTDWKAYFNIRVDGQIVTKLTDLGGKVTYPGCEDDIIRGGFSVQKADKDRIETQTGDTYWSLPQGMADFDGTKMEVVNLSDEIVVVNGTEYDNGDACFTFMLDEDGDYTSASDLLPYGYYMIREVENNHGYNVNKDWRAYFYITEDGKIVEANSYTVNPLKEEVIRGGVEVEKEDLETGKVPQGDAEFAGTTFAVINQSDWSVYTDRDSSGVKAWYNPGDICLFITVGGNGKATSATNALPYGYYEIVEYDTSGTGYLLNDEFDAYFSIEEEGKIVSEFYDADDNLVENVVPNEVIRGGFSVKKADKDRLETQNGDTNWRLPQGNAKFGGTKIEVVNSSNSSVVVNDVEYSDGDVCFSFMLNDDGSYTSDSKLLPYGYYGMREVEGPEGYNINEDWNPDFYISEDGVIVEANSYTVNPLKEGVIRGGVKIIKEDLETGSVPQGEATFEGTTFAVINRSAQSVYTDRDGDGRAIGWYNPGDICLFLTVGEDSNVVESATDALPYGYYEIVEYSVGTGYLLNDEFDAFFEIKEEGKIVDEFYDAEGNLMEDNAADNEVIRGGVYLIKFDSLLTNNRAGRHEHLEGITFSIYSENDNPVVVDGVTYNKGDVVVTIPLQLIADEGEEMEPYDMWYASTANDALPYGTYTIKENPMEDSVGLANPYYFLSEEGYTFSITKNKELVTKDVSGDDIYFHNLPVGRIEVKKVDQQGNALPKCKFILEFSDDGSYWEPVVYSEKHLEGGCSSEGLVDGCLWTDENGIAAFEGLDPTLQYRITELETVNGYTLMSAPVFTGVLERNDDSRFELKIVVINSGTFSFPSTGLNDLWYIPLFGTALFVLGLGALGCTVYYHKRKKKSTM